MTWIFSKADVSTSHVVLTLSLSLSLKKTRREEEWQGDEPWQKSVADV
jgi:hypothetical protein